MDAGLADLLRAARRRIRWAWMAATLSHVLPAALLALAALGLAAWVLRRPVPLWGFVVVPVAVGAGTWVAGRRQRFSDTEVARAVEQRTGCDGVLISALQFTDDHEWHREVRRRAAEAIAEPDLALAIPVRFERRNMLIAAAAVVAVALLGFVTPWGAQGPADAAEVQALEAEAARLDELAALLDEAGDASVEVDESLDEVANELRRLAEEIRKAESPTDAAERLETAAEELIERAGDDLLADKTAVQGLEQQLDQTPLTSTGGDAANQFEQLADEVEGLSPEQSEELADRLDALAQSQTAANPDVARSLRTAADALRAGKSSQASDALNRAAGTQRLAVADIGRRDVAATAANAAAASAGRLRNPDGAGQGQGEGQGQGAGDGEGQGAGEGQGEGQGNGTGTGQGNGSGTPGSGASGQVAGASPSGQQPVGQGGVGSPGQGAIDEEGGGPGPELAEIYDPVGASAANVAVDIAGGQGEGDVVGIGDGTTTSGSSFVPFSEALPGYLSDAATALDELNLPPELRTTVRSYFDQLAD